MQISPDDFHFRIDLWDDGDKRIEQVIAFVSDLVVARAAYAAAVQANRQAHHVAPAGARPRSELLVVGNFARLPSVIALGSRGTGP